MALTTLTWLLAYQSYVPSNLMYFSENMKKNSVVNNLPYFYGIYAIKYPPVSKKDLPFEYL